MLTIADIKRCERCGVDKPLSDYYSNKSTRFCKSCVKAIKKGSYDANPAHFRRLSRESQRRRHPARWKRGQYPRPPVPDSKTCSQCKITKPIADFHLSVARRPMWCKECTRAAGRSHYRDNKEMYRLKCRLRMHRLRSSSDSVGDRMTRERWMQICARVDGKCVYCGSSPDRLTFDHVIPVVSGGTNHWMNFVPACLRCNLERHTQSFVEFCYRRGVDPFVVLSRTRWSATC